jgi:hypothetical protein
MNHEIKVQETEFKAKGKHEVKEQDKNQEPPQCFAEFMKAVQRIEQKVDSTVEEIDDLRKKDIIKMPEIEDVLKSEKDDDGNDNIF